MLRPKVKLLDKATRDIQGAAFWIADSSGMLWKTFAFALMFVGVVLLGALIWQGNNSAPTATGAGGAIFNTVVQPSATNLLLPPNNTPIATLPPPKIVSAPAVAATPKTSVSTITTTVAMASLPVPSVTVIPAATTPVTVALQATPTTTSAGYNSFLQSVVPRIVILETISSTVASSDGYITLANFGAPVDMNGWRIEDGVGNAYTFSDFVLNANSVVRIHFTRGSNLGADLYWTTVYRNSVSSQVLPHWMLRDEAGVLIDVY